MKLKNFKKNLLEDLKNPEFAEAYLQDAIEEGEMEGFLLAFRDFAEANGGLGKLSEHVEHNRVSLYKIFSSNGNPLFETVLNTFNSIGIGLKPYIKDESIFLEYAKR